MRLNLVPRVFSRFPIRRRHIIGKREDSGDEVVLLLARFWRSGDRLCIYRVRPFLSMRGMLLRYSLEPRPNRRVFATAGSVVTVGLAIN